MALDVNIGYVNNPNPDCRCCKAKIEYNSITYYWGLCITCGSAVLGFIDRRQAQLRKRGVVK